MHTFKLKILTPDKKLFEGEVTSLTVPTKAGEITVLKNHTPLISLLSIGEIKIHTPGGVQTFLVQGGVIDIKNSSHHDVVILADQELAITDADYDAEIKRAQEAMKLNQDDLDFAFEESVLERNLFLKKLKRK